MALLFLGTHSYAQELFPEKYNDCVSDRFSLEKDTSQVKVDISRFINKFQEKIGSKLFKKLNGELSLQIIIDTLGNPCLMSTENKTNVSSVKLQLKAFIDESRFWSSPHEKIAVLLILNFTDHGVLWLRRGYGYNGWQDIK